MLKGVCISRYAKAMYASEMIDLIATQLKVNIMTAAQRGDSLDQTERSVRNAVFQLGKQALELFIQLQGDGDLLQEFSQMLAIDQSYEQALNRLGTILGGTFSVDTEENTNSEMGQEDAAMVAAFETAKKNPGNRRMATNCGKRLHSRALCPYG
jgi:hypothetical protein